MKKWFINDWRWFLEVLLAVIVSLGLFVVALSSHLTGNEGAVWGMAFLGIFLLVSLGLLVCTTEIIYICDTYIKSKKLFKSRTIYYENIDRVCQMDLNLSYNEDPNRWEIHDGLGDSILMVRSKKRERYIAWIKTQVPARAEME